MRDQYVMANENVIFQKKGFLKIHDEHVRVDVLKLWACYVILHVLTMHEICFPIRRVYNIRPYDLYSEGSNI